MKHGLKLILVFCQMINAIDEESDLTLSTTAKPYIGLRCDIEKSKILVAGGGTDIDKSKIFVSRNKTEQEKWLEIFRSLLPIREVELIGNVQLAPSCGQN